MVKTNLTDRFDEGIANADKIVEDAKIEHLKAEHLLQEAQKYGSNKQYLQDNFKIFGPGGKQDLTYASNDRINSTCDGVIKHYSKIANMSFDEGVKRENKKYIKKHNI